MLVSYLIMRLEKIKNTTFIWEKITKPSKNELATVLKKYKFKQIHLHDCLPPIQRSRVEDTEKYVFMILTFPIYKKKIKEIDHVEIDFFIGYDFIVTVQDKYYEPLDDFFKTFKKNKQDKNPGYLIYNLLNSCYTNAFPLLNKINIDIEDIEKKLFNGMSKGIIREILILTRNIVNFRKAIIAHKSVIRKFLDKAPKFFPINNLSDYFEELINYTKEIWDSLDNYKDTINALQQSHDSLYQWKLNEIIKTLTIVSIAIFSLTLTAGIFSVNLTNGMPFLADKLNWWKFLGLEAIVAALVLFIFKKKKWL